MKFKQDHFLTDVRLALGYAAVTIAGVLFYADWKLGWDVTKAYTLWAVLAYFAINSALTIWIWGVEKGKVYTGEKDGILVGLVLRIKTQRSLTSQLSIASSVTKHTPIYNITVQQKLATGKVDTTKLSAPFTRWFDADGCFVAKPFQQWLAKEISLVGEADPKNKQANDNEGVQIAEAVVIPQDEASGSAKSRRGKR